MCSGFLSCPGVRRIPGDLPSCAKQRSDPDGGNYAYTVLQILPKTFGVAIYIGPFLMFLSGNLEAR